MGLYLMASMDLGWWLSVLIATVALGMVIFVHELGHFLVAKACGVKVDKFYLGFDIAGLKLAKFTWGETEYGIGILPLGGYVKMLGQEDNPAKLREEIERAKMTPTAETAVDDSLAPAAKVEAPPSQQEVEAARQALYNPRSYLAKSVPKRMAIISAGVIMNLIFAWAMAIVAYRLGVQQVTSGVGSVVPGETAWKANIRPGDQIIEVAGRKTARFVDLRTNISLGDVENGLSLLVRRPGVKHPFSVMAFPESHHGAPSIGVTPPRSTVLLTEGIPVWPGSAADLAKPSFQLGDQIVQVNAATIENMAQFDAQMIKYADKPVTITVARNKAGESEERSDWVAITVPPQPMKQLGLVMEMGEIVAVQADSPAARAGLKSGDYIARIDGKPPENPMTLPTKLGAPGTTLTLTISREGVKTPLEVPVTVREVTWQETALLYDNPLPVPALGLAYRVLNRVGAVNIGSPAAEAGIRPGDVVVRAVIRPPKEQPSLPDDFKQIEQKFEFNEKQRNWPAFHNALQSALPGTQVELTLEKDRGTVTLTPQPASDWFNPDRGLITDLLTIKQRGETLGEAIELGTRETVEATTVVFQALRKLSTQQISARKLNGPIGIFRAVLAAAREGMSSLLLLLTMISANLAVINFLPIPVLDGGHMVFLAYEGLRGKPASERVQLVLTYLGLILILSLMVWVLGLDFGLIARR